VHSVVFFWLVRYFYKPNTLEQWSKICRQWHYDADYFEVNSHLLKRNKELPLSPLEDWLHYNYHGNPDLGWIVFYCKRQHSNRLNNAKRLQCPSNEILNHVNGHGGHGGHPSMPFKVTIKPLKKVLHTARNGGCALFSQCGVFSQKFFWIGAHKLDMWWYHNQSRFIVLPKFTNTPEDAVFLA
jgi:hypothetical protein